MPNMIEVTEGSFEAEVIWAVRPVVVAFVFNYCDICARLCSELQILATEDLPFKLVLAKLIDNPSAADTYKITDAPILALFKKGKMIGKIIGPRTASNLKSWAANLLLRAGPDQQPKP